ncbi:TPA: hypothetical protein MXR76_004046 [Pseudomonas aeruginosa]|uniref:hypothetical protein n=1 Tax=Pseudomonas aeruginosa TaxID=287 RepID=UPI00287CD587|nr:hypothetical protein [Pseudomonas aeruginosa]EKF7416907.1 hypothetical protein [Pseudomonas aeruginosa]EKX3429690.1 hypothetical protein [Pseudomonas aeruginosa]MDS9918390.1 hypothetical protein [Pseudomonas aeruginosa]HCA5866537.1 hypothetical protein [Pseudomonas aeruginosa]HCA7376654.1 hypothetical protein [Pseudomonas aeruginosa]
MSKPPYPRPQQLEVLYAEREKAVSTLGSKSVIQAADLDTLDYLGRCKIANEHWQICDETARRALLNDAHHFVRSCAKLAG